MKLWNALKIWWSVGSLCREVRLRMPLYVRGELSVENAARFLWHINACSRCRREEEGERKLQIATFQVGQITTKGGD